MDTRIIGGGKAMETGEVVLSEEGTLGGSVGSEDV